MLEPVADSSDSPLHLSYLMIFEEESSDDWYMGSCLFRTIET